MGGDPRNFGSSLPLEKPNHIIVVSAVKLLPEISGKALAKARAVARRSTALDVKLAKSSH
jgi:hypothetical protein